MKKVILLNLFIAVVAIASAQNRYVDSLKTALRRSTAPMERFAIINTIEKDYWVSGDGGMDSSHVMEMVRIARQLENDSLRAISYDVLGVYYQIFASDYSTALDFFFKGLPLAKKANDKACLTSLYADISGTYYFLKNPTEVLKYARKADSSLPEKSSPEYSFVSIQVLGCYANYCYLINRKDSALHYLQAIIDINNIYNSRLCESAVLDMLGSTYMQSGDTALASYYFKKAVSQTISDSSSHQFCMISYDYASFLFNEDRIDQAKIMALQGYRMGSENNYKEIVHLTAGLLKSIYKKQKDIDSAFFYSQIELAMNDSLFNLQKLNTVLFLSIQEQLRSMDENETARLESDARRDRLWLGLIALGIVTSIILFLVLSRSIITNEKVIRFLGVLNLLIAFEYLYLWLHPRLEKATNHNPLLMLLAMACIGSILVPLHHVLEKWAIARLIEKNKQVRLAKAKLLEKKARKIIDELEGDKTTNDDDK